MVAIKAQSISKCLGNDFIQFVVLVRCEAIGLPIANIDTLRVCPFVPMFGKGCYQREAVRINASRIAGDSINQRT